MNMTRKQLDIIDLVKLGVLLISLAILVFYVILPMVTKAGIDGFKEEIIKYADTAESKYMSDVLADDNQTKEYYCTDIDSMIIDNDKTCGVVIIEKSINNGINKYVYMSNGKYVYNSATPLTNIDDDSITDAKYSKPYYKNCKSYEEGKIY